MSLLGLRTAVISSIDTEITGSRTVQAHGGDFDVTELKRWAVRAPAVLVAAFGGPVERQGGRGVCRLKIACFIVTHGTSATERGAEAMNTSEAIANLAAVNKWNYDDAQAPMGIEISNLYGGPVDRQGAAMWAVTWTQEADLSTLDLSSLDDLHSVYVDYDLAPKDGVIDMQDAILLRGTLMSAYGKLHIETAVATSISVIDTYQKAAGTTELGALETDMDMPAVGRLRHTGTVVKAFLVSASASVTVSGDAKVTLALAEDGVVDEDTAIEQEITTAGGAEAFSLKSLFNLDEDEYVEVWVKADDTINVTLTKMTLVAAAT